MKEFISILISFIFMSIADSIDSAFNNLISIDAIVVSGSLPIDKCFPYIIFYTFGVFGLYQYESYKTLCITQGKTKILLLGSTIESCIRVIICYLFYNTSIALFVFGVVNFMDFYIRSIIYRIKLRKLKEQILY